VGWFRKGSSGPPTAVDPIGDFWSWWRAVGAAETARAFDSGRVDGVQRSIGPRVAAIEPGLAWEFGPGATSRHQMTVTAAGDPSLRAVARRWLRAAPSPDPIWSFHDLRQGGSLDAVLQFAAASLTLSQISITATPSRTGLDVRVHHPLFATLDARDRAQLAFLALDNALGEEAVELWLDEIEAVATPATGARPLADLPALVAEVAAEHTEDGEISWSMLRGAGPAGPLIAMCRSRLRPIQAPHADQHVLITVPYADRTDSGLPGETSLGHLRQFEDHLTERLGGSGLLVAVESCMGVRSLHYYVDSTTPAADQLRAATTGWTQGDVRVTQEADPGWQAVAHLRG
jgi:hypothetical protein